MCQGQIYIACVTVSDLLSFQDLHVHHLALFAHTLQVPTEGDYLGVIDVTAFEARI